MAEKSVAAKGAASVVAERAGERVLAMAAAGSSDTERMEALLALAVARAVVLMVVVKRAVARVARMAGVRGAVWMDCEVSMDLEAARLRSSPRTSWKWSMRR